MNGFSDVRLILKNQELQAGQRVAAGSQGTRPAGFSRWQWFWHCRRTRAQLQELTPEQLHDIGLSTEQAREEALKGFWQR